MATSDDIQLAPPGAGLSRRQAFVLRYAIFPVFCRLTSWDGAVDLFQQEGEKLVELSQSLSGEHFETRVLVKPVMGIEDSSRYWSAAMVLEHLIEVGTRIATGVVELSHGQEATVQADIVAVKPKGGQGRQILDDYLGFLADYRETLANDVGDRRSKKTLPHPWFGNLDPHHWVCLGAVHQRIHRRQMEEIVADLGI